MLTDQLGKSRQVLLVGDVAVESFHPPAVDPELLRCRPIAVFVDRPEAEIGAGFGWNTDELADHHVPAEKRRTVLREYVEAMRALWTQEEASYDGEFVQFGPSWAYPKPAAHIPLIIGAGGGPKTFKWISENADGWMTTPTQKDISGQIDHLKAAWAEADREGMPDIRILIAFKPEPDDLMRWAEQGVSEFIWGVPDKSPDEVLGSLDRMAARLGIQPPALIG